MRKPIQAYGSVVREEEVTPPAETREKTAPPRGRSTARTLLKHVGTWTGSDGEECLRQVLAARGEATF